jgi:hypothetical protein
VLLIKMTGSLLGLDARAEPLSEQSWINTERPAEHVVEVGQVTKSRVHRDDYNIV